MLELGQDLRLAPEAREAVRVGSESLGEDLDRDLALQLRVGRAVDDPHPALAERAGDLVATEAGAGREAHRGSASAQFWTSVTGAASWTIARFTRTSEPSPETSYW